jgi:isopentenyl-diphosphate delta-isomerase type 1
MNESPFKHVLLVDENDTFLEIASKEEAHQKGLRHRAFSVFLVRKNNNAGYEVLIQKRQIDKYHSGGLWSNTCCSHPQKGSELVKEAEKCLLFEVGVVSPPLQKIGIVEYKASVGNNLIEHEIDHVFCGFFEHNDSNINFNRDEIEELKWMTLL